MIPSFKDFGLYHIDIDYIKYLNFVDPEVRYDDSRNYTKKPFLGILFTMGDKKYFIPLTSAKAKHKTWDLSSKEYYLITGEVHKKDIRPAAIIRSYDEKTGVGIEILAVLDLKKMFPVCEGKYHKIIFNDEPDKNYRSLLIKEYLFCVGIKKEILAKAKTLYDSQIATGVIYSFCCNFKLLEEASDKYQSDDFKMHEKASR